MFFILLGLVLSISIMIVVCIQEGFEWPVLFICIILFLLCTVLGTICDWGHEEFIKAEEYKLYPYEDSGKYIEIGYSYYYFNINENKKYDVEYDVIEEMYVLRKETEVYEQANIETPIIIKYTAEPKKNFFTFGLRKPDEMFKIFIPTGSYKIRN